jgi:hypothetical protein
VAREHASPGRIIALLIIASDTFDFSSFVFEIMKFLGFRV